jgi:general secretion pathway protein C
MFVFVDVISFTSCSGFAGACAQGEAPNAFHHNLTMLHTLYSTATSRWLASLSTLLIWTAAAAVVAYWVLQFAGVSGPGSQAPTVARSTSVEPALADVQKALGAASAVQTTTTVEANARFVLSGVVALNSGQGAALIAVDGQAPKAFKVGQPVVDGLLLQSLAPRQARLAATAEGPTVSTLDMPALPTPAISPITKP